MFTSFHTFLHGLLLIKNELNLIQSPYEILEILKDSLFEQTPVNQLLMNRQ